MLWFDISVLWFYIEFDLGVCVVDIYRGFYFAVVVCFDRDI